MLCGRAAPVGPRCAPRAVRLRVSAVATPRRAQPHAGDEGKLQSVARQRSAAAPVRGRRASPQLRLRSDIREARRAPHGDCKKLRGSAAPLVLARSDRGADLAQAAFSFLTPRAFRRSWRRAASRAPQAPRSYHAAPPAGRRARAARAVQPPCGWCSQRCALHLSLLRAAEYPHLCGRAGCTNSVARGCRGNRGSARYLYSLYSERPCWHVS